MKCLYKATRAGWVSHAAKGGNILHDLSVPNIDSTATASASPYTTPLKPLTDNEKTLLRQHLGCYKCHVFYAGHLGRNCTNPHLTLEDCKRSPDLTIRCYNSILLSSTTQRPETLTRSLSFSELFSKTSLRILKPLDRSLVLTPARYYNDSDEFVDANEVDEYMTLPLTLPQHLHWTCCINAPATCAPTPVEALIDHGSSPVLISSQLAEILCLTAKPLFKPFAVSGAFTKTSNASTPLILTQYCRLSIQSPDALWHAHVINAIICPELHTYLILGLDFLLKNKIVVDTELRTVIAKETGYDLLNPPNPKLHQHTITRSPSQSFTTGPPDIIATIKAQIAQLAGEATLQKLDKQMKDSFVDRFPSDTPHVKDLPCNVYHHIQLLPGAPVSVSCPYGCPWKYQTGWKTLIDQHVAAGRIRPSSSPYASPSFIIPKADPTEVFVLPHVFLEESSRIIGNQCSSHL
ncbi:hypothetical protein L208DRAFT_1292714 [Tricholoma matsutake]|nr:hypothetical protein L208DRAFT_1292714 [Tricholoma matsutake 945]